jgi:hypothetical protein
MQQHTLFLQQQQHHHQPVSTCNHSKYTRGNQTVAVVSEKFYPSFVLYEYYRVFLNRRSSFDRKIFSLQKHAFLLCKPSWSLLLYDIATGGSTFSQDN